MTKTVIDLKKELEIMNKSEILMITIDTHCLRLSVKELKDALLYFKDSDKINFNIREV